MRYILSVIVPIALLALSGCGIGSITEAPRAVVLEFTAQDVLNVFGVGSSFKELSEQEDWGVITDIAEGMKLIRADEALARGAKSSGVGVFVIDDFSAWRFKDGRYHGTYVAAIIKLVAPEATVYTCDAWKYDIGSCLLEALRMRDKIHIVNMSLGIIGTQCLFYPASTDNPYLEPPFLPDEVNEPYEPTLTGLSPDDISVLQGWVMELRESGVTVVSSAGNDGYLNGAKAPGCWSSLRVGAVYDAPQTQAKWSKCIDDNVNADDRVCWSNYGNVFAPGAVITNIFADGISFNGTSASAPFASGVTALVIGTKKIFGENAAKAVIDSAVTINDRYKTNLKHVRIDAVRAIGVTPPPPPPPPRLEELLDKNKNCVLDDGEILTALVLWITQTKWNGKDTISDAEMISLLHKWIKQANICN